MIQSVFSILGLFLIIAFAHPNQNSIGADNTIDYFKTQATHFAESSSRLAFAIRQLDANDTLTLPKAKQALSDCRLSYKRIEFFLEYFVPVTARPFNLPPVYEVEEPYMEYQHPRGMQLMESLLFSDPYANLETLKSNAELVNIYAHDLHAMLYELSINDMQILESLRLELLRTMTLGITGFDAPELKTGIQEARETLLALEYILQPYLIKVGEQRKTAIKNSLKSACGLLFVNPDFDSFDRLQFLTEAVLPLQQELYLLAKELNLYSNSQPALNDQALTIFSKNALHPPAYSYPEQQQTRNIAALGRVLFFETALSGNGKRSCKSCHDPSAYFTDNLAKSIAFNDTSFVSRNAPTLLYAAYQHGQFWDARAQTMEDQVKTVLTSPVEMNADLPAVIKKLKANKQYKRLFKEAFPQSKKDSIISVAHIASAIAAFERSLAPMNSAFDAYLSGNGRALSSEQVTGFNLFMGKAQCGTCHFAPLFNGLLPPNYAITELEILGVPKTSDLEHPEHDPDSGRYHTFPIEYHTRAFKTPGIRNIAKTAPYMHNGAFQTLEQVMDFYNKGGGEGIGLAVQHQTLSSKPLNLSPEEIKEIISFMQALTDSLPGFN